MHDYQEVGSLKVAKTTVTPHGPQNYDTGLPCPKLQADR